MKKELSDTKNSFHLEQVDTNTWNLYKTDKDGKNKQFYQTLKRAAGY